MTNRIARLLSVLTVFAAARATALLFVCSAEESARAREIVSSRYSVVPHVSEYPEPEKRRSMNAN